MSSSHSSGTSSSSQGTKSGRVKGEASAPDMNPDDQISILSIVLLFMGAALSPLLIKIMQTSESTYDDLDDIDDPVALTEKNFRREYLDRQSEEGDELDREDDEASDARRSIDNTVDMAADVLKSEALQEAIASLITRVLESKQFQEACQALLKNLWDDLVSDPETLSQIVQLLNNAIQNKEIQRSVRKLVLQIIQDKEVYDELTRLLVRLGREQEVLDATRSLLTESAHNALNDPEILDHSMEFATDVVGDDIVQRTSGEALRNTVTYAVRPSLSNFLAVLGVGLLLFGLSVLVNSRTTATEAVIVERALSGVFRGVQETTFSAAGMILSLPGKVLSSVVSLLVNVVAFPFKMAHRAISGIGYLGTSSVHAFNQAILSLVRLPAALLGAMSGFMARLGTSASKRFGNAWGAVVSTISASFLGVAYRGVIDASALVAAATSAIFTATEAFFSRLAEQLANLAKWESFDFSDRVSNVFGVMLLDGASELLTEMQESVVELSDLSWKLLENIGNITMIFGSIVKDDTTKKGSEIGEIISQSPELLDLALDDLVMWCLKTFERIFGIDDGEKR